MIRLIERRRAASSAFPARLHHPSSSLALVDEIDSCAQRSGGSAHNSCIDPNQLITPDPNERITGPARTSSGLQSHEELPLLIGFCDEFERWTPPISPALIHHLFFGGGPFFQSRYLTVTFTSNDGTYGRLPV